MPDGPDCDWCGASEEDMDVYTVSDGHDFICQDCYDRLIELAPELLAALKQAVTALNVAKRFRVLDTDSYQIAAMCDAAIAKAEGRE
jgi:hypothetical protein